MLAKFTLPLLLLPLHSTGGTLSKLGALLVLKAMQWIVRYITGVALAFELSFALRRGRLGRLELYWY